MFLCRVAVDLGPLTFPQSGCDRHLNFVSVQHQAVRSSLPRVFSQHPPQSSFFTLGLSSRRDTQGDEGFNDGTAFIGAKGLGGVLFSARTRSPHPLIGRGSSMIEKRERRKGLTSGLL